MMAAICHGDGGWQASCKHKSIHIDTGGIMQFHILRPVIFPAGQLVPVRRCLIAALLLTTLSGCQTRQYLPPEGRLISQVTPPAELGQYTGSVDSDWLTLADEGFFQAGFTRSVRQGWHNSYHWFAGKGDDYQLKLTTKVEETTRETHWLPFLLTLSLWPDITETRRTSTLQLWSGDELVFSNTEPFALREAASLYFPTPMIFGMTGHHAAGTLARDQLNRHALALGKHIAAHRSQYQQAVRADTIASYRDYLDQHPRSFFRADALRKLAMRAPKNNAVAFHQDNLRRYGASYKALIPSEQALWFIGPPEMTVRDLLNKQRKQSTELLASRIRAANAPYKVFSDNEIEILQRGGIKAGIIAAMIDVSAQQNSGRPAATAGNPAALGGTLIQQQGATPATAAPDTTPAAPDAGAIAADCAKRFAAMKACDQVPSFGRSICKAGVRSKYDHLACDLIQ